MRTAVFVGVLIVSTAHLAGAQEWAEYVSTQDGFKINFPGQPKIAETTWKSQMEYTLPARVYSAERGRERYSLTVVDYGGIEQQGIARAKTCPPGNEQCGKMHPPSSVRVTGNRMSGGRWPSRRSSCCSATRK
jgi:hypothetical protein